MTETDTEAFSLHGNVFLKIYWEVEIQLITVSYRTQRGTKNKTGCEKSSAARAGNSSNCVQDASDRWSETCFSIAHLRTYMLNASFLRIS